MVFVSQKKKKRRLDLISFRLYADFYAESVMYKAWEKLLEAPDK